MIGRRGRIVAAAAIWVVAASCFPASPAGPGEDAGLRGETLRVAMCCEGGFQYPGYLDPQGPHDTVGHEAELFRCCLVRTLLSYNGRPTERGGADLHPDLASDMPEVAADGLTWTFRMTSGIRYAPPLENLEVKAADVVRAIQRSARAPVAEGGYSAYYGVIQGYDEFVSGRADTISGLDVVNDHTLRIHLTEVTNDLGYRMALAAAAPIPPNPWDPSSPGGAATGHDHDYGPYLIASGPYMIEGAQRLDLSMPPDERRPASGLVPGESLTLVRNPSWSRATDQLRAAYADRIELVAMSVDEAAKGVDEGTIDVLLDAGNPPDQIQRYLSDPDRGDQFQRLASDYVGYASMNLAVPPFDDVHVRRAVNLVFDADEYTRLTSSFPWGELGHIHFSTFRHLAPDSTEAGLLRGYDPYPLDEEAAHAEMARSMYDRDGDGRCDHPACSNIGAIDTAVGPEAHTRELWAEGLAKLGMSIEVELFEDLVEFLDVSADPSRRIALNLGLFYFTDYPNASVVFPPMFTASGIGRGPFGNTSLVGATPEQLQEWGYPVHSVPAVDAKIDECLTYRGFPQARCWAEVDQLLMTEVVPWVPQIVLECDRVVSARVASFSFTQATGGFPALDRIAVTRAS